MEVEVVDVVGDEAVGEAHRGAHVVDHGAAGLGERVVARQCAEPRSPSAERSSSSTRRSVPRSVSIRHIAPASGPRRSTKTGSEKWTSGA